MMLLQAAPVPIDSLSAREVSELLMDFIHYNQYVTALRLLLEKNKKQYRRAKKKNNKKNTLEMQEYTEAQKWIEEALRPEIAELYENSVHQLLIIKAKSFISTKPEFQELDPSQQLNFIFNTCFQLVQRQWIKCGILSPQLEQEA